MTVPVEFLVYGRPSSVNSTSLKKNDWKSKVNKAAKVALAAAHGQSAIPPPHGGEVTVKIFFFPHTRQYLDVDNGLKHTIDGFSPPVLKNDRTVVRIITERFVPSPGASLIVPVGIAPIIQDALMAASGHSPGGGGAQFSTAVKIEPFADNKGALW